MSNISLEKYLGLDYPIIQAPMAGGMLSPDFVAKVCEFGALGSIPTGYLHLPQIEKFIAEVQQRTKRPFCVNVFVDYADYSNLALKKPDEIREAERELGMAVCETYSVVTPPNMDSLIDLMVTMEVPILSTTFGALKRDHVEVLKSAGVKIMTTVNSVYEIDLAVKTQSPDILIYQNKMAGGHKGGFTSLEHSEQSDILEYMTSLENVYCILSGGVVHKPDIEEALKSGFDGVQIGSGFLVTQECSISPMYKDALIHNTTSVMTTSITGKSARGLETRISALNLAINPGFPFLHFATSALRKHAKECGELEYQSLWCGDGVHKITQTLSLNSYLQQLV